MQRQAQGTSREYSRRAYLVTAASVAGTSAVGRAGAERDIANSRTRECETVESLRAERDTIHERVDELNEELAALDDRIESLEADVETARQQYYENSHTHSDDVLENAQDWTPARASSPSRWSAATTGPALAGSSTNKPS